MVRYVRRQLQKARDTRGRERGATLLWVASMLVLLLGASAFAVDLGWIFLNGSRLQRAADSASLAGVVNLPAAPGAALVDAVDAAGRNGFPIVVNGATTLTSAILADNRYKVDMTTTIDTFFLRAIGFADFEIFKTATAEYIKPVRLGSPDNTFGNGTSDNFWAAINGQYTEKEQGDPYATRCLTTPDDTGGARCNFGSSNEGPGGQFRDWGYFYVVEIGAGSTNLTVDIYEPSQVVTDAGGSAGPTGELSWREEWTDKWVATTFRLLQPDQTPFDPFDNTVQCSETFNRIDTGGQSWNTLCGSVSVSGALTPGMWLIQIPSPLYEGSSVFGIKATVGSGPNPRVYGLFDMSIFVNIVGNEASPFLAEVRPEHEGKTFELDIFDMGDNNGTAWIEILEPDGSVTDCSWVADNGDVANMGACHIDISDQRFNADWLNLTIPLDGYTCDITQTLGCWWKIRIHNEGQAHDRTTWTARITGNPLRLVP